MKLEELRSMFQQIGVPQRPEDQVLMQRMLLHAGIEPRNVHQEMEMSSRFVDTYPDVSFSNASISLHSHSFYEILYCCNTCGVEYLVEATRYQLRKGDIVLLPPGVSHRPLLPENMTEPYRRYVLWLSVEYVAALERISAIPFRKDGIRLLRTAGTRWEYLGELFKLGVMEYAAQAPGWEEAICGSTTFLLAHLSRAVMDQSAAPLPPEKPELLDQVMAYVEQHLAERITLAEVARQFYVSESTITQAFRKRMNVSFYRCVTQRRLIAAKALIERGILLEAVAEQVGFSDYSTFFRAFKQEYGTSPRQYRKRQNAQE